MSGRSQRAGAQSKRKYTEEEGEDDDDHEVDGQDADEDFDEQEHAEAASSSQTRKQRGVKRAAKGECALCGPSSACTTCVVCAEALD
jgi:hypothetical protein